jgi:hypothetical protein
MLGRSRKGGRIYRSRFHPDEYKHGHVEIADAFAQLSLESFAVWIRLMSLSGEELRSGVTNIANLCGLTPGVFARILGDLEHGGFVGVIKGSPSHLLIHRKAIVQLRGTNFVRI